MNTQHRQAVIDYMLKKISLRRLLELYPVDPRTDRNHVHDLLADAIACKDPDKLGTAKLLGFEFGFTRNCVPLLNELLLCGWHKYHEDVASALQILKDPSSIDALFKAALTDWDYLNYDRAFALARKCCWALGDINTDEADQKLQILSKSDNATKAAAAREQLERDDRLTRD